MARRRRTGGTDAGDVAPAQLTVPREELERELNERIDLGEELLALEIHDEDSLKAARDTYATWSEYNRQLLRTRFTTSEVTDAYSSRPALSVMSMSPVPLSERIDDFNGDVQQKIRRLTSVRERLSLFAEPAHDQPQSRTALGDSIFVVHGQNETRKEAVARYLEKIAPLNVIILHERPNAGRTIIEKFEDYAAKAAYAVVILTGDDEGRLLGSGDYNPRARQNVIYEFGFFCGQLGRSRVAVLYEAGVERPSDIEGVAYLALDDAGAWRALLARELLDAGIEIDTNLALR
jgi:predicted nucleotide-binding protein